MRLWYQSFARASEFGAYGSALAASVQDAADPGTDIVVHGIERSGGIADQYRYCEYYDTREVVENAMRAQKEGYDGFLLGNIADPGLPVVRELLRIPVVGLCETSLHLACIMGRRYGLVTINAKFTPRIVENVRYYGLMDQLASVQLMDVPRLTSLAPAFAAGPERDGLLDQFRSAARKCIEDGAEVIVPAGGVVMALLNVSGVQEVDGAPILNGVPALVKFGELAVKLGRMGGGFISKVGTYAPPSGEVLDEVQRFYGEEAYA